MNQKGVSLQEVLIVIVIMGIIATIATPLVISIIDNVKREAFVNDLYAIKEATRAYTVQNGIATGTFSDEIRPYLAKDFSSYEKFSIQKYDNKYYIDLKNNEFETVKVTYDDNHFYYEQTYVLVDADVANFVVKHHK